MRRGLVIGGGVAMFALAIAAFAFRNDQDGQTATAPLTRLANGHYTTPVSINGEGPFAFIVDTGASSPVINPRTSQALGLWGIPGAQVRGTGGSQTSTLSLMRSYKSGVFSRALDMIVVIPSSKLIPDGVMGMNASPASASPSTSSAACLPRHHLRRHRLGLRRYRSRSGKAASSSCISPSTVWRRRR